MSIEQAQEAFNKRMKKRKDKAKNLLVVMQGISKSMQIVKDRKPTAKRKNTFKKLFLSPCAKSPRLTNQLNFER